MQIIEFYLNAGEGDRGIRILKGLEIKDYNLIRSETGDLLIVKYPQDKTDRIIDKFEEEFKFVPEEKRAIIISSPEVILPKQIEKERKADEVADEESIIEYAEKNSYINSKYLALFFFSTVVASLGLITDNIAVVVGAMLIAPAFGPISTVAVGAVMNRKDLFKGGLRTEITGIALSITTAAAIGFILPGIGLNESLRIRMLPTVYDLFIGLAAGAAGAYALISGKGSSIVGVMVAAALVPVMAAIGIGFSFLNPMLVFGAILLLLVNMLAIVLSMVVVFWFIGPQKEHIYLSYEYKVTKDGVFRVIRYTAVLILILTIPLVWLTYEDIVTSAPEREIDEILLADEYSEVALESILIEDRRVIVGLYLFSRDAEHLLPRLHDKIKSRIDERYSVSFKLIETKRVEY